MAMPDETFTEVRELLEIKAAMERSPAEGVSKIQEYLDKQNNICLDIAITGKCGSGKSSFVNAFRGIDNRDEDAAPTGAVETTEDVTPYPHPSYPKVTLWDLPGVGTMKFPAEGYLEKVEFGKYDFFIIISSERFTENDVNLAKEIQRMEKKFYFVRSKIDENMRSEERSQKNFNAEKTLKQIREDCIQNLEKLGVCSPKTFLVSNFDLRLNDFPELEKTLERELPAHKRDALLYAMPNISLDIINKKKEALQSQIKFLAGLSATAAVAPIPGLSFATDLTILVASAKRYQITFGLDLKSLQNLTLSTNVSLEDLKAVMKSPLSAQLINKKLLVGFLSSSLTLLALTAAEEGFRFLPILGIPLAMTTSYVTTYKCLSLLLDTLADDAQRAFKRALGFNTAV